MSDNDLRRLFAPLKPYRTGFLQVSRQHRIYFEVSGNTSGEPLMFLHGGPGSGSSPDQRRLFDPARFNIIQFDQRGCGQSTPHGSLNNNTTPDLVADIALLLDHLEVDQVHLAGGSWGSTLALCFALAHVERVKSLLIYGIFLCRTSEFHSLYFEGGIVSQLYPEVFARYIEHLPKKDRSNPIEGYQKLFLSQDQQTRNNALAAWTMLEQRASRLMVDAKRVQSEMANFDYVLSHSLIENHYFRHNGFIDGDELLKEASDKLQAIPSHIINGRYDLVCPMITAHELHKALPRSNLTIVPDAGHSFREPGMTDAIIRASDEL